MADHHLDRQQLVICWTVTCERRPSSALQINKLRQVPTTSLSCRAPKRLSNTQTVTHGFCFNGKNDLSHPPRPVRCGWGCCSSCKGRPQSWARVGGFLGTPSFGSWPPSHLLDQPVEFPWERRGWGSLWIKKQNKTRKYQDVRLKTEKSVKEKNHEVTWGFRNAPSRHFKTFNQTKTTVKTPAVIIHLHVNSSSHRKC